MLSINPHDASGNEYYTDQIEARERAESEAHDYFTRATKTQLQIYTNTIAFIQPWYGSPRWTRERDAAKALYKATTVDAVLLMHRTAEWIYEHGEISESLDAAWEALVQPSPSVAPEIVQQDATHKAPIDA